MTEEEKLRYTIDTGVNYFFAPNMVTPTQNPKTYRWGLHVGSRKSNGTYVDFYMYFYTYGVKGDIHLGPNQLLNHDIDRIILQETTFPDGKMYTRTVYDIDRANGPFYGKYPSPAKSNTPPYHTMKLQSDISCFFYIYSMTNNPNLPFNGCNFQNLYEPVTLLLYCEQKPQPPPGNGNGEPYRKIVIRNDPNKNNAIVFSNHIDLLPTKCKYL